MLGNDTINSEAVIQLTTDSGVTKKIIRQGNSEAGSPPTGSTVFVHYVGTLASNGTEFDSSRSRGTPFSFKLGSGSVIKGWDIGVATMNKGELSLLTCTSEYAYGPQGSGKIPAKATLNFQVELLYWVDGEDINGDGSLVKKIIEEGSGFKKPKNGEKVILEMYTDKDSQVKTIETELGSTELPSSVNKCLALMKKGEFVSIKTIDETFFVRLNSWTELVILRPGIERFIHISGEGYSTPQLSSLVTIMYSQLKPIQIEPQQMQFNLLEGTLETSIEEAIREMKKGEKSTIVVQPSERDVLQSKEALHTQVELIDFENPTDVWSLKGDERIKVVEETKQKATRFYQSKQFKLALLHYERCVEILKSTASGEDDSAVEASEMLLACTSNVALVQLKLKLYSQAIINCTTVLKKKSDNVKSLYRRSQAHIGLCEYPLARKDLERALEIESNNSAVQSLLNTVLNLQKEQDAKDRALYAKMFSAISK